MRRVFPDPGDAPSFPTFYGVILRDDAGQIIRWFCSLLPIRLWSATAVNGSRSRDDGFANPIVPTRSGASQSSRSTSSMLAQIVLNERLQSSLDVQSHGPAFFEGLLDAPVAGLR